MQHGILKSTKHLKKASMSHKMAKFSKMQSGKANKS